MEDGETCILLRTFTSVGSQNRSKCQVEPDRRHASMVGGLSYPICTPTAMNCGLRERIGTHTRPDELTNIRGTPEHTFAAFMDAQIRSAQYQTIVHGDAKLAIFFLQKMVIEPQLWTSNMWAKAVGFKM